MHLLNTFFQLGLKCKNMHLHPFNPLYEAFFRIQEMMWTFFFNLISLFSCLTGAHALWTPCQRPHPALSHLSLLFICPFLFYLIFLPQVLGLKCWQSEMDISGADPCGRSSKYMLVFPPHCVEKQEYFTPPVWWQLQWHKLDIFCL